MDRLGEIFCVPIYTDVAVSIIRRSRDGRADTNASATGALRAVAGRPGQ